MHFGRLSFQKSGRTSGNDLLVEDAETDTIA